MNLSRFSILRAVALAALLSVSATISANASAPAATDAAQNALTLAGSVEVKNAGPYVHVGSYRIWVSSQLGKPSIALADGTWLYNGFAADDSRASGTLLVKFDHGRVIGLQLVSSAVVATLRAAPKQSNVMVADNRR